MKIDIEKEKTGTLFLKYTIPSVMAMIVSSIYIVIDGIFIGNKIGSDGLAAITICLPYISLSIALSVLFTVGGGTITNIFLGKKDLPEASRIFGMTLTLLLLLSVLLTAGSLFYIDQIVSLLGASEILFDYVKDYLWYSIWFTVFYMVFYLLDMGVRGTGHPNYSMKVIIFMSVLNIILDYFFIFVIEWGMRGAALASGLSHAAGTLILLAYFIFINHDLQIRLKKIQLSVTYKMLRNGFSEFVNSFSAGITIFLFNFILMRTIGETGVAIFSIVGYLTAFILAVFYGISEGILPVISYNYGAENYEKSNDILMLAFKTVFVLGAGTMIVLLLAPGFFVTIFVSEDPELLSASIVAIRLFSVSFLFSGCNIVVSAFFTAIEQATYSAIISVMRSLIMVIVGLLFLPLIIGSSGIWLAIPFAEMVTLILAGWLLKNKKIKKAPSL